MKHGTTSSYSYHKCRCDVCREYIVSYQSQRAEERGLSIPDSVHGTYNGYKNYKCRCEKCYKAAQDARASYSKVKTSREYDEKYPGESHGEELAYKRGCRCKSCKLAHELYSREYKKKRAEKYLQPEYDGQHGQNWMYSKGCRCAPCKEAAVDHHRMKTYGLSRSDYNEMILAQESKCAICGDLLLETRHTHVDHDHTTRAVRGILCSGCNLGLGGFRDSEASLLSAIGYLKKAANLE